MKIIFVLALLFQSSAFAATASIEKIRNQLTRHKIVEGNFKQVRFVKDLGVQLDSEGTFQFELPLKLHWMQKTPFALDLLMTPEKIVQTAFGGSEQVMTKESQPVIFMFSSSFLSVFSGDEKKISENFAYQISSVGDEWTIRLTPTQDLFKKAISDVVITGSEFVEKVLVTEKLGSSTQIVFSKVKGK